MSLNSQYIVLFKNPRDRQQIGILARQMYPGNVKKLLDAYEKAVSIPYGALVLDLKQTTQESKRFQTDIFEPYIRAREHSGRHLTAEHQTDTTSQGFPSYYNTLNTEDQRGEMAYQKPYQDYPEKHLSHYQRNAMENPHNLKTYTWPSQLDTGNTHSDEKYPSCAECGAMYVSSYDLQRHVKKGCPMEENSDENDAMSDVSDEDDDGGFSSLVNEVLEENQSQFEKKYYQLMEEKPNLSKTEAREEANEMMLPQDRNLFLKKYKGILLKFAQLNQSKLHRNIKKEVSTLKEKKGHKSGKGRFPCSTEI